MGRFFTGFIGVVFVIIGISYYLIQSKSYDFSWDGLLFNKDTLALNSPDFNDGGIIPVTYTCDGRDISPSFFVGGVPINAKSLVILMEDTSMITQSFTHWISFNLNPQTVSIENAKVLGNASTGVNDFGNMEYNGPCPPLGESHKYTFRVYALDVDLDLKFPRREVLNSAIRGHIIASGSVTGVYSKNP